MIVDTGASTNIQDQDTFDRINYSNGVALEPTVNSLFGYSSADHLETMGKFRGTLSFQGNQKHNMLIHVLNSKSPWYCQPLATGVSAILVQKSPASDDKRVVAYASQSLTSVERQ